jgi:hypothetical protein|tara:strand:+ start:3286 stop:3507 length:222 start_codon:yes stop_codon:yes gene_type:complete
LNDILEEFKKLKEEDEKERKNDVFFRTIEKLLAIERRAIYGTLSQKHKRIEAEIDKELNNYSESRNANKTSKD